MRMAGSPASKLAHRTLDIALSVKDAKDLKRSGHRSIDDQVGIYRPEANTFASCEVIPFVADVGVLSKAPAIVPDLPAASWY